MVKPYSARSTTRGRVAADVAVLTSEIAVSSGGRDVTRAFVGQLREPRDPRLRGAVDWGAYDAILKDDQVFSTFQQRRTAVVSRNWSVLPGDEADPRSVEAADTFGKTLDRIGWDRVTDKMLFARFHGYAVAEIVWQLRDGLLDFGAIKVRHARRFRETDAGDLVMLTPQRPQGEDLPARKFWKLTMGGADDDEWYGRGLAEWLYWPCLFKRNGIRFWNIFLDKFGAPTALAKYRPGMAKADIARIVDALKAIATDAGIVVPDGVAVELLQATRSGTGDYAALCRYMDEAIAKIILSQTMTTQDGSSLSQAQVHAGVKLEVVKADADLLSDSFNADDGPSRWWTDLNYGPDVAHPRVVRDVEEEADTSAQADTDTKLKALGWERDDESFQDTYGEGYVRTKATTAAAGDGTDPAPAGDGQQPQPPAVGKGQKPQPPAGEDRQPPNASFAADDPRTLYVYRQLLNPEDLIAWAREQGFSSTLPAEDLHVTITYSKRPVNWMRMGGFWGWGPDTAQHLVPPGGPRMIERLGENAVALVFTSGHLEQRHREMVAEGASWDYASYFPHVTITYAADGIDLAAITPFRGELRFGPEIFEPLDSGWEGQLVKTSFAEPATPPDGTMIDQLVDQVVTGPGYTAAKPLTDAVLGAVRTANTAEELATLLGGIGPVEQDLARALERASFAMRIDVEQGGGL